MRGRLRSGAARSAPFVLALVGGGCFVDAPPGGSAGAGATTEVATSTSDATTSTTTTTTTTATGLTGEATTIATDETAATTGCALLPFHLDDDGDTFGDPRAALLACEPPPGHVADGSDCDDASPTIHPGADEICDALDNDCDDLTDEWSATNSACGGCEMQLAGESVYHRCAELRSWGDARVLCQGRGGDLAIIQGAGEQELLAAWIAGTKPHWIGLGDQAVEGDFLWVDGAAPTVKFWGAGEPNNSGGNEDCVQLIASSGLWNDLACGNLMASVCESPAPP